MLIPGRDAALSARLETMQGFVVNHPYAPFGSYRFFEVVDADAAVATFRRLLPLLRTGTAPMGDRSSTYVAFTAAGFVALGVDASAYATFPPEFREGMAARARLLGDVGESAPERWLAPFGSERLHGGLLLFAKDAVDLELVVARAAFAFAPGSGLRFLDSFELGYTGDVPREHFGYREGITRVCIEGVDTPSPGEFVAKIGEFVLGHDDEFGERTALPHPDWLTRDGSFLAFRAIHQDVAAYRAFLESQAATEAGRELLAAKMLGRWRSGTPLVLAPESDDPSIAEDPARRNSFAYAREDPLGLRCPLGAHIRRVNPRDTNLNTSRRRIVRRGMIYGPPLPEGAPDDGVERGLAFFAGCADLSRQFEFIQREWIDNGEFQGLGRERDPIAGSNDGTTNFSIPHRPVRRTIPGIPHFTRVRGGEYFFLPSIGALARAVETRQRQLEAKRSELS